MSLQDKVVLVTGSSSGIGAATVASFAELGCRVVVHGRDKIRVEQVVKNCLQLSPKGYTPLTVIGDLRDGDVIAQLIEKTIVTYGRLDILICNAGFIKQIHIDQVNAFQIYSDTMQINLNSVVMLTSLAVPHLKKSKGCIVNVVSNLHQRCFPGGFAYCAAKAGLLMFTKSVANDLAPDVRVNSVSPGPVATNLQLKRGFHDLDDFRSEVAKNCLTNRVCEPAEIARTIVFLASPESSNMTGTDIIIDGGSTIKT